MYKRFVVDIDESLVVVFMFKYYLPEFDLWTLNYIVFENTFAGGFITSPLRSLVFRPNIQEKAGERVLIVFESLSFACAGLLLLICFFDIYLSGGDSKSKKTLILIRIFKFRYVLLYITFFANLVSIIAMGSLRTNTIKIFDAPAEDYVGMHDWYQALTYAQYLAFACTFIFILRWIRLFHCFRDMLYILRKVIIVLMSSLCILY